MKVRVLKGVLVLAIFAALFSPTVLRAGDMTDRQVQGALELLLGAFKDVEIRNEVVWKDGNKMLSMYIRPNSPDHMDPTRFGQICALVFVAGCEASDYGNGFHGVTMTAEGFAVMTLNLNDYRQLRGGPVTPADLVAVMDFQLK